MKKSFATILLLLIAICVNAQLSVPDIISSNMVLQASEPVAIWGKASKGEKITVFYGKQKVKCNADKDGNWELFLKPMQASFTPQVLTIKGKRETLRMENVVVGEVWIASGQSNTQYPMIREDRWMKLPLKGEELAAGELAKPANESIRVLISGPRYKNHKWQVADGKSLERVSAMGYFFIKNLQDSLNVPVGIITAALGGTRIEAWTKKEWYQQSPVFKDEIEKTERVDDFKPEECYRDYIAELVPYTLRGFIWYQGENNCGINDNRYAEKMRVLVSGLRSVFKTPNAPFNYVLLAPHVYSDRMHKGASKPTTAESLPRFREEQKNASEIIPNTDYVCINDLVDNLRDIHPSYKWEVGKRLAKVALTKTYGRTGFEWTGPRLEKTINAGNSLLVTFSHVGQGLKSNDNKRIQWFEVAGDDGIFHPAYAEIEGKDQVKLKSDFVEKPTQARFGWHETAQPNLINSEGLPAITFGAN